MGKNIEIKKVNDKEFTFAVGKHKFAIKKGKIGVYSGGECWRLYNANDPFDKKFIVVIGWTKTDHGYATYKEGNSHLGAGLFGDYACHLGALDYVKKVLA